MWQFIKDHFDKILLTLLFLYMVDMVVFLALKQVSPEIVSWARELAAGFQGALLGLITGVAIGQRMTGNNNIIVNDESKKVDGK